MAFFHFVQAHVDEIRNYVQPAIQWRKSSFARPVEKAEATGGDFAEVIRSLPETLRRDDVVACMREDLYKGFVAAIVWGGLSRFRPEEIARRNDRASVVPKLERIKALLQESNEDSEKILEAVASMGPGRENHFYGIGPSYFTKLLYFLSADMELAIRPLIYDENMKPAHFALMPEFDQNPFEFYLGIVIDRMIPRTRFENVYLPFCEFIARVAAELGVDVTNLESWLFGWKTNIKADRPNPRVVARQEAERMRHARTIHFLGTSDDIFDAIGVARIFNDNELFDQNAPISYVAGRAMHPVKTEMGTGEHPIVINEADNYVHLEHATAAAIFKIRGQMSTMTGQRLVIKDGRYIDVLSFRVEPDDSLGLRETEPEETMGFEAIAPEETENMEIVAHLPEERVGADDFEDPDLMEMILKDLEEEEDGDESLSEDFGTELVELYFDITAGYTAASKRWTGQ